jgi:hypothetical protein
MAHSPDNPSLTPWPEQVPVPAAPSTAPAHLSPLRITLNASAVRSLISPDSEAFLEVERLAAGAVAEELRRKLVPEKITKAVESAFQEAIARITGRETYLTPELRGAVQRCAQTAVQAAVGAIIADSIRRNIDAQVDAAVKKQLTDHVKSGIDAAIRARLDSVLRAR